jgi:hypothetical protein
MQKQTRPILCLLAALALGLAGCQNPGNGGATDGPSPSEVLAQTEPVQIVDQMTGNQSALDEPTVELVKTQQDLQALGLDTPEGVDLAQQDLVIQALGEQNTGGYAVRIDAIQKYGNRLFVQSTVDRPSPDAAVTQQITYPYAAAVIPNTDATSVSVETRTR